MPKKYHNKSLYTKPQSSVPASLTGSTTTPSHHGRSAIASDSQPSPSTVNELISHLRQTQISNEQRLPGVSTSATLHPSLRQILDVPNPLPPRARPGTMRTSGPTRTRRIPGPPPPASWLQSSKHAPRRAQSAIRLNGPSRRIEQSSNLPGGRFPPEGTLQHTILKVMASNWKWHLEYDHRYLADLPVKMKETLLSYIAIYGYEDQASKQAGGSRLQLEAETVVLSSSLRLLFPRPSDEGAIVEDSTKEASEVVRLDFGNALGVSSTMRRLAKVLFLTHLDEQAIQAHQASAIPDSWDDDEARLAKPWTEHDGGRSPQSSAPLPENPVRNFPHHQASQSPQGSNTHPGGPFQPPMTPSPKVVRFPNLVHLSLALPPAASFTPDATTAATWPDLLQLASSLPKLTSLSLANWPRPTLTPRASNTYSTIKNPVSGSLPGIPYGGSNMYSSFDDDWTEAGNILKRLSRHLYCLKWLDLTGIDWHRALTPDTAEWNGAWRGIEYIGLGVGWYPEDIDSQAAPTLFLEDSGQVADIEATKSKLAYLHGQACETHTKLQNTAREIAGELRQVRSVGGGKWINFDFGPQAPVPPWLAGW